MCNTPCGAARFIDGLSASSWVTCWSWALIPAPVALWLCSEIKSCFQNTPFTDRGFQQEFTMNHGPLSRAPGSKRWAEAGLPLSSASPPPSLRLLRKEKGNNRGCTHPFLTPHRPGGVFMLCPQSKGTLSTRTKL